MRFKHKSKRYCSQKCRNKNAYLKYGKVEVLAIIKKCAICGKPFTTKKKNAKFCSRKCCTKGQNKYEKICLICQSQFKGTASQKYCGNECRKIAQKLSVFETARLEQQRNPKIIKRCLWCKNEFKARTKSIRVYCLPECNHEYKRVERSIFRAFPFDGEKAISEQLKLRELGKKYKLPEGS